MHQPPTRGTPPSDSSPALQTRHRCGHWPARSGPSADDSEGSIPTFFCRITSRARSSRSVNAATPTRANLRVHSNLPNPPVGGRTRSAGSTVSGRSTPSSSSLLLTRISRKASPPATTSLTIAVRYWLFIRASTTSPSLGGGSVHSGPKSTTPQSTTSAAAAVRHARIRQQQRNHRRLLLLLPPRPVPRPLPTAPCNRQPP